MLEIEDIKFFRSMLVTDDPNNNGGRMDETNEIISNVKYNLFPRVTYSERMNGYIRYRKEFMANRNADNEGAYGAVFALLKPSNGGDRFYIRAGTQTDMQADMESADDMVGGGKLFQAVNAGDMQIQIEMEANDYFFPNGGLLIIADFDEAQEQFFNTCFVRMADDNQLSHSEDIATADGTTTSFSSTLAHPPVKKNSVEVIYTIQGNQYNAQDDGNGNIQGPHLTAGTINYETGSISLEFDTAPDNGTPVTCNYVERCYSYTGNVVTVKLKEQIPRAYSSSAYAGVALELGDLVCQKQIIEVQSSNGNFDDTHLLLYNEGSVYDEWQITFQDNSSFTCSGVFEGAQPNGSINADYQPINPRTGKPFFKIEASAWGGSWQTGDVVRFKTYPSAKAIFWKEVIPAGCNREPNNKVYAHWAVE